MEFISSSEKVVSSSISFSENEAEDSISANIEKARERNREHAKKTRLRKKASLEGLKARLLELQAEVIFSIQLLNSLISIQ